MLSGLYYGALGMIDGILDRLIADQVMDNLGKTSHTITPNPDYKTVDVTLKLEPEKRPAKPPVP